MEYNLREAANLLGIKTRSLMVLFYTDKIEARKTKDGYVFSKEALEKYREEHRKHHGSGGKRPGAGRKPLTQDQWREKFDLRHGEGAYKKLLAMFGDPCNIYEDIGDEFGVTKQAVELWHYKLYPNAQPYERKKACDLRNRRQELFSDETFRAFYRAARRRFKREEIEPIKSMIRFRTSAVKLRGKKVLIRKAGKRRFARSTHNGKTYLYGHGRTYTLHGPEEDSAYVFYKMTGPDFLFMPRSSLIPGQTMFIDSETSKYHKFKNNFDAFDPD